MIGPHEIFILIPLALFAVLIFKIPELGLVLCLVIGSLLKGMIQPFLGPIDITAYLFVVTYGSIFILCSMEKKLSLPDSRINIGVLLFAALLLASLLYTPLPEQGTDIFLRFVFLTISMVYATFMWCTNIDRIKRVLFILTGISLAYGTAAFIWVFGLGHSSYAGTRAPFPETPVLGIAQFLAVGILTAFILRRFINSKRKRLALDLLTIMGVIELIALNSRGPLIAFLAGAVCLFLLYSPREKRRLIVPALAGLAAIICVVIILPSQYTSRYALITHLESSSIAARLGAWQYVVEHFSDWFFTGAGIFGFAYYYFGGGEYSIFGSTPHNVFLGVFSDVGFLGFLVFMWLICVLLYKGIRLSRVRSSPFHLLSLAALIATITLMTGYLFGGALVSTRGLWFFGGLILSVERIWGEGDRRKEATCFTG